MDLPTFRYHPDPIASESVARCNSHCPRCDKDVQYVYAASIHSEDTPLEEPCPWCIASGEAHRKHGVLFTDPEPLIAAGLPPAVIEEVTQRTPGFSSWQGVRWACHCDDACAFMGDATADALRELSPSARGAIWGTGEISDSDWDELLSMYEPADDPSIYHFKCLHCGQDVFHTDNS